MSRLARFAFRALALAAVLSLAGACGDDEEAQEQPTAPGADESPQPEAEAKTPPAEKPAPPAPAPAAAAGEEDPEKECLVRARCERKCESECAVEERDRSAFFAAKRARVSQAPFEVRIDRAYLDGSCHSGDKPEKRRDANGIAAVVEGEVLGQAAPQPKRHHLPLRSRERHRLAPRVGRSVSPVDLHHCHPLGQARHEPPQCTFPARH